LPKEKIKKGKRLPDKDIVLVEFKAPRELMEEFDVKIRPRFSNRSEAIRTLIRMFVDQDSINSP